MARYFPVSPGIWNKRVLGLGDVAVITYTYILTCSHRNSEGLYRLPRAYIATDLEALGYSREQIHEAMDALEREHLIAYDDETDVILDYTALHLLPPKSPTQIEGAMRKIRQLPRTRLLSNLYQLAKVYAPMFAEALNQEFPQVTDSTETVSHTEPEPYDMGQSSSSYRQLGDGKGSGSRSSPLDSEAGFDCEVEHRRIESLVQRAAAYGGA